MVIKYKQLDYRYLEGRKDIMQFNQSLLPAQSFVN